MALEVAAFLRNFVPATAGFDADAPTEEHLVRGLVPKGNAVLELVRGQRLTDGLAAAGCAVDVVDAAVFEEPAATSGRVAPLPRYDTIVLSDVLGYAREPVELLKKCAAILSPGGFIVTALPNFGCAALRVALASGAYERFEKSQERDLRRHFFTPELSKVLLERAGFHVEQTLRRTLPWDGQLGELRRDPDETTLTYVIKAVPAETLERRLQTVESQLEAAIAANGELRGQVVELRRNVRASANAKKSLDAALRDLAAAVAMRDELLSRLHSADVALADARDEIERVKACAEEAERIALDQTNALLESTKREVQRLSGLIDVVQTSRFWAFKRVIARLRGSQIR